MIVPFISLHQTQKFATAPKYLVSDELPEEPKKPKDLKVADLACGSGHILNECFDILYDLYIASGYDRRDAIENIFADNLLGIDIDERARQLSTFALMLKACQKDETFADAHALPRVLGMSDCSEIQAEQFFKDSDITGEALKELREAFKLMKDADSLGSIMKFDISVSTREVLQQTLEYWQTMITQPESVIAALPAVRLILALTDSYDATIANPPYMTGGKMNEILSYYVKQNYSRSSNDMFAVFMEMMIDRTKHGGRVGCITMDAWMFLSSFEDFREHLINNFFISSLGHFGWNMIGIAFGTAMTIFENTLPNNREGEYSYLTVDDLSSENVPITYPKKDNGRYARLNQNLFKNLPTTSIAYWVSPKMIEIFQQRDLAKICETRCGLATGQNEKYLRLWHEVKFDSIGFYCTRQDTIISGLTWYPYDKGGEYRKWYGNRDYLVNWFNDGYELQNTMHPDGKRIWAHNFNLDKIFQPHIGWSDVIGINKKPSFRYFEKGFNFDGSANAIFTTKEKINLILAYANCVIVANNRKILNSGSHFKPGNFLDLPFKEVLVDNDIVESCVTISKEDWDAHETSWDFQENELITLSKDELGISTSWIGDRDNIISKTGHLDLLFHEYEAKWNEKFLKLHANEEELNRKFIEIYGLQDELTPNIPFSEVTILQQGEISVEKEDGITDDGNHILMIDGMNPIIVNVRKEKIVWHRDVIIKQLISYIVGCYMGRYRLDKPGLAIAHPDPTDEELAEYKFNITGDETFSIDSDAIIPLLPINAPFYDNLVNYISEFVRKVWGEEALTENMNFIERCLGKPLNDYLLKDFWKDHKKMYQNRPIYWLFSSKKGAFRAMVYVHRMHAYTVEQVRSRYLLKYMDWLRGEISKLEQREADLSTQERRSLDRLRSDLAECDEYHERLQVVAEQAITFDLDDGIPHNHALFGDILMKLK